MVHFLCSDVNSGLKGMRTSMDGHSGLENKELQRSSSSPFQLVLALNTETNDERYFVLHAHSSTLDLGASVHPLEFLARIGFSPCGVACKFFPTGCLYKYLWELPEHGVGIQESQAAHQEFHRFAQSLPKLYGKAQELYRELGEDADLFPWAKQFQEKVPTLDLSGAVPHWIEAHKLDEHKKVEESIAQNTKLDKHYQTIEYLLWGTGTALEDAVVYTLRDMELEAKKTPKAHNIDAYLKIPSTTADFGIEITGINKSLSKRSPKITQVLKFQQDKQGKEKAVLIANTFNELPVAERSSKEHFTKDALDLLTSLKVVCFTTTDLYAVWKATKFGGDNAIKIFQAIYDLEGGQWQYPLN